MTRVRKDIYNTPQYFHSLLRLLPTVGLVLLLLLSGGCITTGKNTSKSHQAEQVSVEEQFGVKVESLRTSASGHLLDFRYRIKDPDKAVHLVDRRNKPYLVDQASGKVLSVPTTAKVGPMRQTTRYGKPKQDRVYFVLFGNPGVVKAGDQVTVVIGDFKAENLVVQ